MECDMHTCNARLISNDIICKLIYKALWTKLGVMTTGTCNSEMPTVLFLEYYFSVYDTIGLDTTVVSAVKSKTNFLRIW